MTKADDERVARLSAALRDNLRRRKAQSRGRSNENASTPEPMSKTSTVDGGTTNSGGGGERP